MARAVANKLYRTFVKGLISEASELTYPENSTLAEDNCIIYRKGNRSRRLGFKLETDGAVSSYYFDSLVSKDFVLKEYEWFAVANDSQINFIVRQMGRFLYFYDASNPVLSLGLKPFVVDLNQNLAPNQTNTDYTEVQMAAGKGYLFVAGEKIEPLIIEYDPDTDTLKTERIYIQIRDFKGVEDGLANDAEPTSLSVEHHYNLRNQGWVDPITSGGTGSVQYYDSYGNIGTYIGNTSAVITQYFTATGRYPGHNKQWWAARDATTNAFDPDILETFYSGNNRAPRGHYVVNAFNIDRTAVSGLTPLPAETVITRPVSVAFGFGRVFWLCASTVYFSQVLSSKGKAGLCYQEADPTSEDISELLPTDGGTIEIPEMSKGVKLVPLGAGIVVFGINGIWSITGTSAGFSATDISISKVNPIGCESPNSIVEAEGQVYWWSRVGILAMSPKMGQFGPVEGIFDKVNISEQTIQTFYQERIPENRKIYAKGRYDPATNTIQWLYADDETIPLYTYNRVLNLDLTLQAFYPWSLSVTAGPLISGIFLTPKINLVDHPEIKDSFFKYCLSNPDGISRYYDAFGRFEDLTFADFKYLNGVGASYMSFAETGYELLEDAMRGKMTPYVFTYFRKTEENYVADGDDYKADKPSSCYMQVRWNWSDKQSSGKWSTKVQAYRHRRLPQFDESDLAFETGSSVVVAKHKFRGTGKSVQFRFECDELGHDFDLLGWAVNYTGATQV
jgi:hypothetical protein